MTDFSSISFSDISIDNSDHNLDSSTSDVDLLLSKLGTTLMEVKQLNGVSTDLFTKLSQLVRQTQQKLQTSRQQNLEAHRRCLQHIEILLFQQDYVQALAKIDYYKRQQLNNISFESVCLSQRMNCEQDERDIENINFQQAKDIITSQFADFNLKQRIWLKYALNEEQIGQQLTHVTHEQVQQAIFQNFRRQFQIEQEITEMGQIRAQTVTTPQKKNSKSASHLKNSSKNNKSNNKSANLIMKVGKSNQKSSGKLANPSTRSSQKRTCRKNGSKIAHQSATAKKINSPSPFVV